MLGRINKRQLGASCGALAAAVVLAACGGSSSSGGKSTSGGGADASSAVLTAESSQQNTITQVFNPYVTSSGAALLGATSLLYEPLMQANVVKPGQYYPYLASGYKWSNGGDTLTFTIRNGVKWSNGTPLTAKDVAFTYNMLKQYADVNTVGLTISSVSSAGNTVTLTFPSPQYSDFENIASEVYIVPESVWSKVGDPGKYPDANPVGSGPYILKSFTSQGITFTANPHYWGGEPAVKTVEFPTYASSNAALSALQTNQLTWGGNFITGVQKVFEAGSANHKVWFPPVNTVSLEPNLQRWPTNQLAVRKAISLAIDRTDIGEQGEGGLEPPVQNASGLTLPVFQKYLSSSVSAEKLNAKADAAAAGKVLAAAGYTKDSAGFFALGGKEVKLSVTDPASYSDYAADDAIVAKNLQAAGINATFVGQSVDAWSSDIADGDFQLTMHWSQTSVAPYQLYNDWLNSALATKSNRAGNYEGLKDPAIDADLKKLAGAATATAQAADLAPIEQYVATNLPVIPTVYGVVFDEYNTTDFSGWPDASNEYESGSPNAPTNEVVVLHLKPKS
jgi:peptide/nickel transport system substrate-binding protein